MNSNYAGGIGDRKLPSDCFCVKSDKFNLSNGIELEAAQIANVNTFVRPMGDVNTSPYTFR